MLQIPPMNLSPEATPWGKSLQSLVLEQKAANDRREQGEKSTNRMQTATTGSLQEQVQALEGVVSSLNDVVTNLAAVALNQVSPTTAEASASNFAPTTTATAYASITVTVPAGYTRAVVMAVGSITTLNFSGAVDQFFARVTINGSAGPEQAVVVGDFNTSPFVNTVMNVSASNAQTISGLTGGGTFTVQVGGRTAARAFTANTLNVATVSTQVLFLK